MQFSIRGRRGGLWHSRGKGSEILQRFVSARPKFHAPTPLSPIYSFNWTHPGVPSVAQARWKLIALLLSRNTLALQHSMPLVKYSSHPLTSLLGFYVQHMHQKRREIPKNLTGIEHLKSLIGLHGYSEGALKQVEWKKSTKRHIYKHGSTRDIKFSYPFPAPNWICNIA